jgi:hypothetical protein
MSVTAVIVNYRTPAMALDCIQTLSAERAELPRLKVLVIDSGSGDESVRLLVESIHCRGWNDWVSLQFLNHNSGFAFANNVGITQILADAEQPEFIWLLNPDTLVRTGAARKLIDCFTANPRCGIAGSRLEDSDETVQRSAFRFHTVLSEVENALSLGLVSRFLKRWQVAPEPPRRTCRIDWVCGASMMVRGDVFRQVGLLDAGYFMYFEETDFCLTAARAGWETWYVPASRVVHLVGQSSGVTSPEQAARRRPAYWFDSRHRYFRKNQGAVATFVADLAWAVCFPVHEVLRVLRRRPRHAPSHFWRDFIRNEFRLWTADYRTAESPSHPASAESV